MRLWLRLTLVMAVVSLLPLVVNGALALRSATRAAQRTSQTNQQLTAALHADFVGVWARGQVGFLVGWRDVYTGRLETLKRELTEQKIFSFIEQQSEITDGTAA